MTDKGIPSSSIDAQFEHFQQMLSSTIAQAQAPVDQQLTNLKRLRKDNQLLTLQNIQLLQNARLLTAVKSLLSTSVAHQNLSKDEVVENVSDSTVSSVLANFADYVDDELMSQLYLKLIYPVNDGKDTNNNNTLVQKSGCDNGKKMLTRRRQKLFGGVLIDPFRYHDCLICPRGFYQETHLRLHYNKDHSLDFGSAPLPSDDVQIKCLQVDRQVSHKCHLCGIHMENLNDLLSHKSLHVDAKFCKYKCPNQECSQTFVLQKELDNHVMCCHKHR